MFIRTQDRNRIINLDAVFEASINEHDVVLNSYALKPYHAAGIQTVYAVALYFVSDGEIEAARYIDRKDAEDALEALCDALRDDRGYLEFPADYKFMEVQNEGS